MTSFVRSFSYIAVTLIAVPLVADEPTASWKHEELRRFPANEANQGVSVDAEFFYAITNSEIGKYRKDNGDRVGGWKGEKGGPIVHLNAGLVRGGKLYCAHSNYPHVPATSTLETFDTAMMEHVDTHSFGVAPGSLTWVDLRDGKCFACFAHYAKDRPTTGRGPEYTEIVRFDDRFRRESAWVLPRAVLDVFGGSSSSGGAFGPDGNLFITGHDAPTLFVLRKPKMGATLELLTTIPISAHGQAFAWDPTDGNVLYSISRPTREVIVSRITKKEGRSLEH
jgi:hypothetical protein